MLTSYTGATKVPVKGNKIDMDINRLTQKSQEALGTAQQLAAAFRAGVDGVQQRGKAERGEGDGETHGRAPVRKGGAGASG